MNIKYAALTAIAAATLAAPLAQAETHSAPGTICQPYHPDMAIYYTGGDLHVSNGPTSIMCPLTRSGWGGAKWAMVVTTGISNGDPSYIRCTFDGASTQSGSVRNLHVASGSGMTRAACYLKAGDRITSVVWQD